MNQLVESLSSNALSANIQKAQIEHLQDEILKMPEIIYKKAEDILQRDPFFAKMRPKTNF